LTEKVFAFSLELFKELFFVDLGLLDSFPMLLVMTPDLDSGASTSNGILDELPLWTELAPAVILDRVEGTQVGSVLLTGPLAGSVALGLLEFSLPASLEVYFFLSLNLFLNFFLGRLFRCG
jgi:hypothetical protein